MRHLVQLLLALSLGVLDGISPWAAPPQESPVFEDSESARPYVPPPAWKSLQIGNYYFKKKNYGAALSRYEEAVATDPYFAPAYRQLGKTREKLGFKEKALKAYKTYLEVLPSAKQAEEAKDVREAIARLEQQSKKTTPQAPARK